MTAKYTDKFSSGWATLILEVTRESSSIANNTSYLEAVLKIRKDSSCSSHNDGGASISMTINGLKLYSSKSFTIEHLGVGSTKTLATEHITVSHNNDGTKSVSCKAYFDSDVGLGDASIDETLTLTRIPRASSFTLNKSSVNVGDSISASITRYNASFDHTVRFYINDTYTKTYTDVPTSQAFTIPSSWYSYMPSSTSCTAHCKVTTKNGSSTVGDSVTKSFTVNVPSSIKPSVGSVSLTPTPITISGTACSVLVKGKNSLTITANNASAGTGSSIKEYTFTGPGLSKTTTSNSTTMTSVGTYGESLTFKVVATDKRGRKSTEKSNTITCYAYSNPSVTLSCSRSSDSESITCTCTPTFSPINGYNSATIAIYLNGSSTPATTMSTGITSGTAAAATITDLSADATYTVYAKITDGLQSTGTSKTVTSMGAARIFNVNPACDGIAFGKKCEYNSTSKTGAPFDVAGNASFGGTLNVAGNASFGGTLNVAGNASFGGTLDGTIAAGSSKIPGIIQSGDTSMNSGSHSIKLGWTGSFPVYKVDSSEFKLAFCGDLHHAGDKIKVCDIYRISIGDDNNAATTTDNIYALKPNGSIGGFNLGTSSEPIRNIYLETTSTTSGGSTLRLDSGSALIKKYNSSSRRYKKDIAPITNENLNPEKLYDINVFQYKYKEGYLNENDERYNKDIPGFIAEDVLEKYPIAVNHNEDGLPEMWEANILIPPMLELIQKQKAQIDSLEERLTRLETLLENEA